MARPLIEGSLGIDTGAWQSGLARARTQASGFSGAMSGVGQSLGIALGGAAFAAAGANILKLTGQFEQLRISFRVLIGDAQRAEALLAQVVRFADVTPFETEEVAAAAKQLLAYRIEVKDIIPWLTKLGNIASGLNLPLSELVDVFGRNQAQTRVMTKDLREFMTRGVPVLDELAKRFGVAREAVMEMASDGKIHINDLNAAISSLSSGNGQFAGMMEEQSKSLLGVWSTLKGTFNSALRALGEPLAAQVLPGLRAMNEWVDKNKNSFRALGEAAGGAMGAAGRIAGGVGSFGGQVAGAWQYGASRADAGAYGVGLDFGGPTRFAGSALRSLKNILTPDNMMALGDDATRMLLGGAPQHGGYLSSTRKLFTEGSGGARGASFWGAQRSSAEAFERQLSEEEAERARRGGPTAAIADPFAARRAMGPAAPDAEQQKAIAKWIDINAKSRLVGLDGARKAEREIVLANEEVARINAAHSSGRITDAERMVQIAEQTLAIDSANADIAKERAKVQETADKKRNDEEKAAAEKAKETAADVARIRLETADMVAEHEAEAGGSAAKIRFEEEKIVRLRAEAAKTDDPVERAEKLREIKELEISVGDARIEAVREAAAAAKAAEKEHEEVVDRRINRTQARVKRQAEIEGEKERDDRIRQQRDNLPKSVPAAGLLGYDSSRANKLRNIATAGQSREQILLASLAGMRSRPLGKDMGFYARADQDNRLRLATNIGAQDWGLTAISARSAKVNQGVSAYVEGGIRGGKKVEQILADMLAELRDPRPPRLG